MIFSIDQQKKRIAQMGASRDGRMVVTLTTAVENLLE
jgi:hypothetical protein